MDPRPAKNLTEHLQRLARLANFRVTGPAFARRVNLLSILVDRLEQGQLIELPGDCVKLAPGDEPTQKWLIDQVLDWRRKGWLVSGDD